MLNKSLERIDFCNNGKSNDSFYASKTLHMTIKRQLIDNTANLILNSFAGKHICYLCFNIDKLP